MDRLRLLVIIFGLAGVVSCRKDKTPIPIAPIPLEDTLISEFSFSFDSLYGNGKAHLNQDYTIYAMATGKELQYQWQISSFLLVDKGSSAILNTCCVGDYLITCTVSDFYGNAATKELNVFVGD